MGSGKEIHDLTLACGEMDGVPTRFEVVSKSPWPEVDKKSDRDGTRIRNPLIRSQMRYPLRHTVRHDSLRDQHHYLVSDLYRKRPTTRAHHIQHPRTHFYTTIHKHIIVKR